MIVLEVSERTYEELRYLLKRAGLADRFRKQGTQIVLTMDQISLGKRGALTVDELPNQRRMKQLLLREYKPPPLFIFEEVELGSGYHTLHVVQAGLHQERDWSEPYKKSSEVQYRNRIVRVPYPPEGSCLHQHRT
jgi:hypothetical protein